MSRHDANNTFVVQLFNRRNVTPPTPHPPPPPPPPPPQKRLGTHTGYLSKLLGSGKYCHSSLLGFISFPGTIAWRPLLFKECPCRKKYWPFCYVKESELKGQNKRIFILTWTSLVPVILCASIHAQLSISVDVIQFSLTIVYCLEAVLRLKMRVWLVLRGFISGATPCSTSSEPISYERKL